MNGEWTEYPKQKGQIEEIVLYFKMNGKKILYNGNLRLPGTSVSKILGLAHHSKVSGHLKFAKTMSRITNFHWRHRTRDVNNYVDGCLKGQK